MDNIRILIVDDLQHVRRGLATLLKLASLKERPAIDVIGEAQNGSEAIQLVQNLHPDVVLLDLEMPVMDGFTAIHGIKLSQPLTWVIVLTIHGDLASRQKAVQAGADAFIEKGAPLEELIQTILKCRETQ
jgi:DNA-binding NarL/FixJ family response regulator